MLLVEVVVLIDASSLVVSFSAMGDETEGDDEVGVEAEEAA